MVRQLFCLFSVSLLSVGAIAMRPSIPSAIAQRSPNAAAQNNPAGMLKLVMVDQARLTPAQYNAFQQYLQTANLPPTKIGKRCQYYGRPQIWCLLLDPAIAEQIYQQLSRQSAFGAATEIKTVRRLKGEKSKLSDR